MSHLNFSINAIRLS